MPPENQRGGYNTRLKVEEDTTLKSFLKDLYRIGLPPDKNDTVKSTNRLLEARGEPGEVVTFDRTIMRKINERTLPATIKDVYGHVIKPQAHGTSNNLNSMLYIQSEASTSAC